MVNLPLHTEWGTQSAPWRMAKLLGTQSPQHSTLLAWPPPPCEGSYWLQCCRRGWLMGSNSIWMDGFSPLAKAKWAEAAEMGYPTFTCTLPTEAAKQYASFLCPANLLGLLMDLNVPKVAFRTVSRYKTLRAAACRATTGYPFPRSIPTRENFFNNWKEMDKPHELRPPVSILQPPTSGRSWPLQSWARYVQSRPSLAVAINWTRPLKILVCRDVHPCCCASCTKLCVGLLNHGALGRTPAY